MAEHRSTHPDTPDVHWANEEASVEQLEDPPIYRQTCDALLINPGLDGPVEGGDVEEPSAA